jgi:hypothetical protein
LTIAVADPYGWREGSTFKIRRVWSLPGMHWCGQRGREMGTWWIILRERVFILWSMM